MGGFPTSVRTTGGKYASGWLDLRKVSVVQREKSEIFTTHLGLLYSKFIFYTEWWLKNAIEVILETAFDYALC